MRDYPYKAKIETAVNEWSQWFQIPEQGAREYLLQNRCKADFCFHIGLKGHLFIEDDDGVRGLNNLIKYWIWCLHNPEDRPIHVVHILETSRPAQIANIRFLGERMQESICDLQYHMVLIENWQVSDEEWLPAFRQCLMQITGTMSGEQGPPRKAQSLPVIAENPSFKLLNAIGKPLGSAKGRIP